MKKHRGFKACATRIPWVPPEAPSVVHAVQAAADGRDEPLSAWRRHGRPALVRSFARWAKDDALAEEIADRVVVAAWIWLKEGRGRIENPSAWIARFASLGTLQLSAGARTSRRCTGGRRQEFRGRSASAPWYPVTGFTVTPGTRSMITLSQQP